MLSRKNEIALLQLKIKHQELLFDKSMSDQEEFAKTKLLFDELKKMIDRLDELKRNGVLNNTANPL
jgi:hypothetical protein